MQSRICCLSSSFSLSLSSLSLTYVRERERVFSPPPRVVWPEECGEREEEKETECRQHFILSLSLSSSLTLLTISDDDCSRGESTQKWRGVRLLSSCLSMIRHWGEIVFKFMLYEDCQLNNQTFFTKTLLFQINLKWKKGLRFLNPLNVWFISRLISLEKQIDSVTPQKCHNLCWKTGNVTMQTFLKCLTSFFL